MRHYEMMVILDPQLEERTIAPSIDQFLTFEINKQTEGLYAVIDMHCEPATVAELDRQLNLNESILRTKVIRPDIR